MELVQYWKIVRKSIWLVLAIVALGVSGTAIYSLNIKPEYESSTTLFLNPSSPNPLIPYAQTQLAANLAESYNVLIHTRSFAESVAKEVEPSFSITPDQVIRAVTTRLEPNTLFYRITARIDHPQKAQMLASTVARVFISANAAQTGTDDTSGTGLKGEMRLRLDDKLKDLDDQIGNYNDEIKSLSAQQPSKERDDQLLQLRGQLIQLQQTETSTMAALANLGVATNGRDTARVIDPALPGRKLQSKLATNVELAFAASLVFGVALAFFRDYLDYTIHSPEQLETLLKMTPMGAIGRIGSGRGKRYGVRYGLRRLGRKSPFPAVRAASLSAPAADRQQELKLITLEDPRSPISESFRVLRTNIQFTSIDKPIRSLVVTSSQPQEGKSFTASNLAVVMAQAGRQVVLVDADLRKPSLHRLFDLPNTTGFTNMVLGKSASVPGATQHVAGVPNLVIVTSGPLPPNPSELLSSAQCLGVMSQLCQQAEIVIYDSAPAAAVTDPVILATRVDATILVVNAGVTRRDVIGRVKTSLQKVGVSALLPILNKVRFVDMQGYYQYYYYEQDTNEERAHSARMNGSALHINGSKGAPVEPGVQPHESGKNIEAPQAASMEGKQEQRSSH